MVEKPTSTIIDHIEYTKVDSDDYGDTRWQWYIEVFNYLGEIIWTDYYKEKPTEREVRLSISHI